MIARVGSSRLAVLMGVPCAILRDWMDGTSTMPDGKLIALIHLIDETAENGSASTH